MKNRSLLRISKLFALLLAASLLVIFLVRTNRSEKVACALEEQPERAAISASAREKQQPQTFIIKQDAESNQAAAAPAPSDPASSIKEDNPETSKSPDSVSTVIASSSEKPSNSQEATVQQSADQGTIEYKECELLVKFKAGVDSKRIEAIDTEQHTKIVKIIDQIGVYHLSITDGTSAVEMIKRYQGLPEVEYAELNSAYGTPEGNSGTTVIGIE